MNTRGCLLVVLGLVWAMCVPVAAAALSPPHFTSDPPLDAIVGVTYTYDSNATDPDNDPLTYYLTYKVDDMTIDPTSGFLSWTPSKAGPQPITIYVTDSITTPASQTFTVNVTPRQNFAPNFTSKPSVQAIVGQTYVYNAKAVDPEGDKVFYFKGVQSPRDMNVDQLSGRVTWTPGQEWTNLSAFVLIIVKDSSGLENTQSFNINVTRQAATQNNPPAVLGTPVTNVTEGDLYYYAIDAVDPDGDRLSFCITMGPADMVIDNQTGVITWTPSKADVRVQDLRVLISDGANSINYTFSVNVHGRSGPHFNEDPAPPNTSPEVLCAFLPVMAVLILVSIFLARSRKQ